MSFLSKLRFMPKPAEPGMIPHTEVLAPENGITPSLPFQATTTTASDDEKGPGSPPLDEKGDIKVDPEADATESTDSIPQYDWDSEEFRGIPDIVRETVGFEDDPTELYLTFRVLVLSTIFCLIGSVVSQITYFRTTTAPFPVFFVILASLPLGKLMARTLPTRVFKVWKWSFSMNPGPFTNKEHVMIGICANAGSQGQWSFFLPANAAMYYDITLNPAVALFFGWGTILIGFSFAAMVRPILIDDPRFLFPISLQQVAVYRSLQGLSTSNLARSAKQMRVFWYVFAGIFVWQFFPAWIMPFTAALAPLCWFNSRNHKLNFLGAGRGGAGFLNITLDWSNITSTIITYPYSVQLTVFAGFAITIWVILPIAYFKNLWGSPTYNIMSNTLFLKNGTAYPFKKILDTNEQGVQVFNEAKFDEYGIAYAGAQFMWDTFFWYASYVSAYVWCGLFLGPTIWTVFKERRAGRHPYNDRLCKIQRSYPGLALWHWLAMFIIPAIILLILVVKGTVYMPIFTYFVALGFGAASMLPMSLIYATSGYPMKVGIFNELIYGYMLEVKGSSRHPLGQLAYRILSGNTWYDARTVIEDQKIGHYFHLPPRAVIGIQLFGSILSTPVNYGILRAVLATKFDYVSGRKKDPQGQWTGQQLQSYNSDGIQYALVGPKKLFAAQVYKPLPYGFVVGIAAPIIVFLLAKRFPKTRFDLFNTTIFFSACATFHGNISTGPFTMIILGTITNFYLYRYRHVLWTKFAYICGAALDTGFNANLLFIFIFLGTQTVQMPHWWGNNADNIERCFALKK